MSVMNLTAQKEFNYWPANVPCEAHVLVQIEFPSASSGTRPSLNHVKEVEGLATDSRAELREPTAVAQNLELRVETAMPVSLVGSSRESQDRTPDPGTVIHLGDVQAGDLKQVVLRVHLPPVHSNKHGSSRMHLVAQCSDVRNSQSLIVECTEIDFLRGTTEDPPSERNRVVWSEVWRAEAAGLKLNAVGALGSLTAVSVAAALRSHVNAAQQFLKDPAEVSICEECKRLEELARQIEKGATDMDAIKQISHNTMQQQPQRDVYYPTIARKYIRAQILSQRPEEAKEVVSEVLRAATELGFSDNRQHRIRLGLNEMLDNALQHGCKGRLDGTVVVDCDLTEDYARLIVTDDGPGFDAKRMLEEEERTCLMRRKRGRGLLLVHRMANRFEIDTRQGTRVEAVIEREAPGVVRVATNQSTSNE
jgi:anti-sigma regulatory factor (Ser/Thr protein kinase)